MNVEQSLFNALAIRKEILMIFLKKYLHEEANAFRHINQWSVDIQTRLLVFLQQGKMIRGGLILLSSELFGENETSDSLYTAAAMELIHASLLIHDDIMDRDYHRRGKQSIFAQYETMAKEQNLSDTLHFGESMGICVGDYAVYLAYNLLTQISNKSVSQRISQEIAMVVLAQMQDLANGYTTVEQSSEAILHLYTYKTGRYTFALPLLIGAQLANKSSFVEILEKIGEILGRVFQMKDDELNLFGDEKVTGKPVGSDLRENKKTYHRLMLFEKITQNEKEEILKRIRKKLMNSSDLSYIYDLLHAYQIKELVQKTMDDMTQEVRTIITQSQLPMSVKDLLFAFISYNETRVK